MKDKTLIGLTLALVAILLITAPISNQDVEAFLHKDKPTETAIEVVEVPTVTATERTSPTEETEPQTEELGEFLLTAYCTCELCCEQWADGYTATGTVATPGRTVAVDPEVIPLGSLIYINGQEYVAEDVGGAIVDNRVDILFPSHEEALQFGVQYANVSIIEKR